MADRAQRMDSFRLLLNEISHELREENLQSLIHISGVPGAMQKQMKDGLTLFSYLIQQDFISREKIGNLRNLIRKMRPRRKDLLQVVDKYIKKEFQTDDVRLVLDDFSESWEQVLIPESGSPASEDKVAFRIECGDLHCVCRQLPSCYTPLIISLFIAIFVTALFWCANVPKISPSINSNPDLKRAGVYIIILEVLALVVLIGVRLREKLSFCLCIPCPKREYESFNNPTIQEEPTNMVQTSSGSSTIKVASPPRKYKGSVSSESAMFSSYTGGSVSTFGTMDEPTGLPMRVEMDNPSDRSKA